MPQNAKLLALLEKLVVDGRELLKYKVHPDRDHGIVRGLSTGEWGINDFVEDHTGAHRWYNNLILLRTLMGDSISPWTGRDFDEVNLQGAAIVRKLAAVETIKYAVEEDLLTTLEELIIADTFADLIEQGRYLFEQGYVLAAGVIFRAVLEERLRKLCVRGSCTPPKPRPTIDDFNQALYKANPPAYGKSMMLHITAIAAIGNDAAHNNPDLSPEDVKRLASGVEDFLAQHS